MAYKETQSHLPKVVQLVSDGAGLNPRILILQLRLLITMLCCITSLRGNSGHHSCFIPLKFQFFVFKGLVTSIFFLSNVNFESEKLSQSSLIMKKILV